MLWLSFRCLSFTKSCISSCVNFIPLICFCLAISAGSLAKLELFESKSNPSLVEDVTTLLLLLLDELIELTFWGKFKVEATGEEEEDEDDEEEEEEEECEL